MSIFDLIPTAEEVLDFVACRLTGHTWEYGTTKDGLRVRVCKDCEKVERIGLR